jgi:hypothetical protein
MAILMNHKISLTPILVLHWRAQDRIGTELASKSLVFWANVKEIKCSKDLFFGINPFFIDLVSKQNQNLC